MLSVIIPVYNAKEYLEECVNSVLAQTYRELQVILVDDGSQDGSEKLCDNFAKNDPRVHVIHKKNGGPVSARNAGLDYATGEWIMFVDGDDYVEAGMCEHMMQVQQVQGDIDIVCCSALLVREGQTIGTCFDHYPDGTIKTGREIAKEILLDKIGSHVWRAIYRKQCWEEVRFPNRKKHEDMGTAYKVFLRAEKVAFVGQAYYKYRVYEQSLTATYDPMTPYYAFSGFKEHYECAVTEFPEIAEECAANVAHYGISTYFHYCGKNVPELEHAVEEVLPFLEAHKQEVLRNRTIPRTRRMALRVYYTSNIMFRILCRITYFLGLQKK